MYSPRVETVLFLTEKVACPLFYPLFYLHLIGFVSSIIKCEGQFEHLVICHSFSICMLAHTRRQGF